MATEARKIAAKYLLKTPTIRKSDVPRVIPNHIGELQADIMYLSEYGVWSGGYKYVLNVIDAYSRYVWSFPYKKLTKVAVKNDLVRIIDTMIRDYDIDKKDITVTSDQGSEFSAQAGTYDPPEFFIDSVSLPVRHVVIKPAMGKGRTVLVERFNRTLHEMLRMERFEDPNNRSGEVFVRKLQEVVNEYNQMVHSTLKATPMDVLNKEASPAEIVQKNVKTYEVGDVVLVAKKLDTYQKRSAAVRWDPQLWRVTGQVGWRYTLSPYKSEEDEQSDSEDFDDIYGYLPLGSQLMLVKPADVDAFLKYEVPKRVTAQIEKERDQGRIDRAVEKEVRQISYPSATQMSMITPTTEKRVRKPSAAMRQQASSSNAQ